MRNIILCLFVLLLHLSATAELKLSPLFSDGMVLQQKASLPVWGWTDAGTEVTVSFAGNSQSAKAGTDGKWMVKLPAVDASAEGRELTIKAGSESKVIKDVLVGEIWICGGQSNMDFTLAALTGKAKDAKHEPIAEFIRQTINTANDPLLRQIKVPKVVSAFEVKDNFDGKWVSATPGNVKDFTATGYFFAAQLRKELGVPVGLLNCNWGGTRVEPWIPMEAFQETQSLKNYYNTEVSAIKTQLEKWDEAKAKVAYEKQITKWKEAVATAKKSGKAPPRKPNAPERPDYKNTIPSTLYNGMLNTLVPYAIKGAIWYQGESNAGHFPDSYQEHFSTLIKSWRKAFGQGDFYFYWAQLAQFKAPSETPIDNDGWVTVCDQQRLTLQVPNTGMAVLNDIGEANDIHPKNKFDAGKRLSLWALKQAYGKDIVYSGPLFKSSKIDGSKIIITFDNVGSGLMVGSKNLLDPTIEVQVPLKRFQICGADKVWKWADAKITGTDTVEVSHKDISAPVEVRYAWASNAEGANLYNKEGLPASLFKTK